MKNLKILTLGTVAFALAPLAQANAVTVFDSSVNQWTSTSSASTTNGATTTITPTGAQIPSPQSDYFNLPTPVSANSGIWILTATIDQSGVTAANEMWAGLGNAVPFNNGTSLQNGPAIIGTNTLYVNSTPTSSGVGSQGQGLYTVTHLEFK